jgi:hypothetical protein
MFDLKLEPKPSAARRIEVFTGTGRRRWSPACLSALLAGHEGINKGVSVVGQHAFEFGFERSQRRDACLNPIAFLREVKSRTARQPPRCSNISPDCAIVHADKVYDADAIRCQIEARGAMPHIPPKANRKWKNCFSPVLYRDPNAIERDVLPTQGFPVRRDTLRLKRGQFPRRRLHRRSHRILVMSPDPSMIQTRAGRLRSRIKNACALLDQTALIDRFAWCAPRRRRYTLRSG